MEEFELEPGEVVIKSVRTHLFVLVTQLIPFLIAFFVPAILGFLLGLVSSMNPQAASLLPNAGLGRFVTGIWYLLVWTAAFSLVTRFYLTVWVITNLRIVDIKQYSFFNREVSSFLLTRVQDITTDVSGVLGTLIGFGRLSVETAGKDEDFQMANIAHPEMVRDVIMSQVAQLHHADIVSGV
jgi:hypothetical protein